jgi:hypothetical protein
MNKKGNIPTGMPSFASIGMVILVFIIIVSWIYGPAVWARMVGIVLASGDAKIGKDLDEGIPRKFQIPKYLEQSFEELIFAMENSLKKEDQKPCLVPIGIKIEKNHKISALKEFEGMSMRIIQIEDGRDGPKTTKRYIDSILCVVADQFGRYSEVSNFEIVDNNINMYYLFKRDENHICFIPANRDIEEITKQMSVCQ